MKKQQKNRKVLILGGDGMAGHMIKTFLREMFYDVFSTTRGETDKNNYFFDVVKDFTKLEEIIRDVNPDFIVNGIGVLNQFAEERKEQAILINSFLPHYLDSLSEKLRFKLIHISTDCVFSGEKGAYMETDIPDASSFYGRTKSLGEVRNGKSLTLRTSIVGPDINEHGIGLFNWFIKQEHETKGFSGVIWTGVTTLQLAKVIEKIFDLNITGLYHLVNNKKISKFDLLSLFKKHMRKDIVIKADSSYKSDKSLIDTRKDPHLNIPDYDVMIKEMSEWIYEHESLYGTIILNAKR